MNRIEINYISKNNNEESKLFIYNDIKGYSYESIGSPFYGKDADIMLEYFKNATIKKNNKVISYGIYIDGKRYIKK